MNLYPIGWRVCAAVCYTYFRLRIEGREHVPRTGAFVLAANHVSYLDPPVLGVACPRRVHFIAKAELFKVPLLGALLPHLCAFPVHRGAADRSAIRHALDVLRRGEVVGVFPEGTRSRSGELLAPQGGAAMLALKAGVPVVPVGILGTDRVDSRWHIPKPVKVTVRFGRPLQFSTPEVVERTKVSETSQQIMAAIGDLLSAVHD